MADESKLSIVIDAENRAKSVFSDAQNDLKGFGKSFEDTAKGFKQFGVGIEAVGVAIGGLLVTTGLYAARVEVLDTVLQNVGKVSNVSSDILKEQENVIKKLGITTQEAKETLILFMQGQLDVAQASKIARVAQDLAVIAGVNSSEATKTLTQAIISQEPMLLRNFGIVQNLNDVYLSYGKEIGIASEKVSENGKITTSWTRDLTDVEKRQAMLNMILAEGAKVSGTYEAAMGDAGKQLTSLPRYIDEAKLAFGQAFIPIIGEAVKILTNLLKAFTALSPETQKIITYVAMATATFTLILGPILLLIGFLPAIASGFAIILGPVGGVIITFTVLMATIGLVGYTIYYAVKNWQDICVGFGIYFDEFKIKIIGIWDSIKNGFLNAVNWIKEHTIDPLKNWINSILEPLQNVWDSFNKLNDKVNSAIGSAYSGVKGLLGFAEGGIVPGALGSPMPAIVHGGETIIPAGKSLGSINITITGNTFMSDEEAAEKIGDRIIKIFKMQNRFAF